MANRWAPTGLSRALAGGAADAITLASDTLKLALMASAYTPAADLTATPLYSSISASEAAGTGYVAGGITVPSPATSVVYANSFTTTWAASTAFAAGSIIRPGTGNGHLYMASTGGTSAASTPTFPTGSGTTVTDASVVWTEIGTSLVKFSSGNIVSPSMSLTSVQYGWIYDTSTTNADLICLLDFGSAKTWTSTVVTFTPDANLGWVFLNPS